MITDILFNPVIFSNNTHSIDFDKYSITRRFDTKSARAKLKLEYVCSPLDMLIEDATYFMQDMCNEIEPIELHKLELGASISYQRKDTGKMVKGIKVIRHNIKKDKSGMYTLVGYQNNGSYISDGRRKKIANGANLAPTKFSQAWAINLESIERLFVVKSEIDILKALIIERDEKIDSLIKAVNTLKGVVSSILKA